VNNQLDIFAVRDGYVDLFDYFDAPDTDADGLRYYQREAYLANLAAWEGGANSVLNVMATGLGKTTLFCAHAKHWPGNVLILAHRDELVTQAAERLRSMVTGRVDIEKAEEKCLPKTRLVVGSVQSVCTKKRLERLGKNRFDLIIIDEGHHALSPSYRSILDYFDCKKLLVTATPDRGDEKALGQVVDQVGYVFDIAQGIDAGYLVPVRGESVRVDTIDLSAVESSHGELVEAALDNAMVRAVEGIVHETMRLHPSKRAIAFFPGVKSAEYAAEKFNAVAPGSTCFISGTTPEDERKYLVHAFKTGKFTRLCNCDIATEGFDAPATEMVIMASPTLSRAKYCQRAGRGTRVLPGVVDSIHGRDNAGLRRAAIAGSRKPSLLLLDFVGDPGRHSLMGPVDVLSGDYTEEEVALAKKKAKDSPEADQRAMLDNARAELLAIAKAVKTVAAKSKVSGFDPFGCIGTERPQGSSRFGDDDRLASQKQRDTVVKFCGNAMTVEAVNKLTAKEATRLIGALIDRSRKGLASMAQMKRLAGYGLTDTNITRDRARQCMDYLASECNWGKSSKVDPVRLNHLAYGERQPGED
jgi:superfamily II DNA or RNA helicase